MKLFVVSDVHSFYTPLKEALDAAGFDPANKEHLLISCGDAFDRGEESEEVLHYLMTLENKILIKGNHDLLLEDCCKRGYWHNHDQSNGTVRTINDIGGAGEGLPFNVCCNKTLDKTQAYRDLLVNYYETQNYIFVHSWIPTNVTYDQGASKPWYQVGKKATWMENWREANDVEWEEAMWGNPFVRWVEGLNKTGKTIVFGHWHCSAGHKLASHCGDEFKYAIWEPFYGEGIIAIDRCTVHTGQVNVLVLEDELLV